jgi:3-deoxy-7-phosphoheptulonate synthase
MIIVLKPNALKKDVDFIMEKLKKENLSPHISKGVEREIICVIGDERKINPEALEAVPCVEKVIPILKPFKLASRDFHPQDSIIKISEGVEIGEGRITIIAGPCAVESKNQLVETAKVLKATGIHILRGGAYKPRTSPYSFQGLGEEGLKLLKEVKEEYGLAIVTEVLDTKDIEKIAEVADILQIGARNMQNFALLKEVGKSQKPVLLKRGMSSTITEFLMAAEYILSSNNYNVILCERGIRTFSSDYTRNTLDIAGVAVIKELSHLPIIVDPSHGSGKWWLIEPLSKAAIAAGADGLMIEIHPNPKEALSDGEQSLNLPNFTNLIQKLKDISKILGKIIL